MNEDIDRLHAGLRPRTWPLADGDDGDTSDRHVVDLHGLTIDVRETVNGLVVDLNSEEATCQPVTVTLDGGCEVDGRLTPQRLAALVAALGDTARYEFTAAFTDDQLGVLHTTVDRTRETKTVDAMVEVMWVQLRELGVADRVNAVVFNAQEWDNGWFVDVHGVVHLTDGTVYGGAGDVEFNVEQHLTALYGQVSPGFKVGLRMAGSSIGALPVEVFATADAAEFAAEMHLPAGH